MYSTLFIVQFLENMYIFLMGKSTLIKPAGRFDPLPGCYENEKIIDIVLQPSQTFI
jgi:hypothetical protein